MIESWHTHPGEPFFCVSSKSGHYIWFFTTCDGLASNRKIRQSAALIIFHAIIEEILMISGEHYHWCTDEIDSDIYIN